MTNQIRTTSLSIYNTCPYKWKYGEVSIPIETSSLGDILHFVSRHPEAKDKMLEWYSKNINPDLKTKKILSKLLDKVIEYKQKLNDQFSLIYTEIPFVKKISNTRITGTADLVGIGGSGQSQELLIIDWKTSSNKNWYDGEDIRNESLQSTVYSYLAMEYFGFDKAKFRYVVFEKTSSASVTQYERDFIKQECEEKIKKVISEFEYSEAMEDYKPKQNRMCYFCELKSECPLYKIKTDLDVIEF